MELSKEYIEQNLQKKGKKRIFFRGSNEDRDTYLIPISCLYFNDLNGRISTFIAQYENENPGTNFHDLREKDLTAYNDLISGFIKKSSNDNLKSFKATKEDIRKKGQQVAGVVLSDGRIIDGNRRFTAIRELALEDQKFAYFEAAIFEAPASDNRQAWKDIKILELGLQENVDEKRDYDPIESLASFYTDNMNPQTKLFDNENEYCRSSGMTAAKFKSTVNVVETMLDYLEFIGKPGAFYYLHKNKLDGPLEELAKTRKKLSVDDWNDKKIVIYKYLTINDTGDRTREIRNIAKSAVEGTSLFSAIQDKVNDPIISQKINGLIDNVDTIPTTSEESNQRITNQAEASHELSDVYSNNICEVRVDKLKGLANDRCIAAKKELDKINDDSFAFLTPELATELQSNLTDLDKKINDLLKKASAVINKPNGQ